MNHNQKMLSVVNRIAGELDVCPEDIKKRIPPKKVYEFHVRINQESPILFGPSFQAEFFDLPERVINHRMNRYGNNRSRHNH